MFASLTPLSSLLLLMSSHGRLSAHHRRGVRHQDHRGQRSEDQAADLGHGGSGALQSRHAQLLQRSGGSADGVRHHQVRQSSRRLSEAVMMETDVCVCVCVSYRRSTYNHLSSWLTDARNLTNPNTVSLSLACRHNVWMVHTETVADLQPITISDAPLLYITMARHWW